MAKGELHPDIIGHVRFVYFWKHVENGYSRWIVRWKKFEQVITYVVTCVEISQKGVNFIGCVYCMINGLLFIVFLAKSCHSASLINWPNDYFATFVSWFDYKILHCLDFPKCYDVFWCHVTHVGCLYNLVMSVSTMMKYFLKGLNVYSGGCQCDFTLKMGMVLSFWCLK